MDLYESRRCKLKILVLGAAAAGKTSLLRRYVYRTFSGDRVATRGSDFYIHTLQNQPMIVENEDGAVAEGAEEDSIDIDIHLQLWDTPGRERFYIKNNQPKVASLSDNFFTTADGVLLVYDMTSSTSFTQLLRWYADLMQIRSKIKGLAFPILIVGNKLDAFQAMQQRATRDFHPRRVAQRDVLGLQGKHFKGKDFQYEYRVSSPARSPLLGNHKQASRNSRNGSNNNNNKQRHKSHHNSHLTPPEVSSFLANRENWTKDNSYLDSLLNSEEGSHPDHEMVLLWCMRNGLQHVEVSAATGQGVDEAFEILTHMALEHVLEVAYQQQPENVVTTPSQPTLDLQERYRPKEEDCCFGILPPLTRWWRRR